MLQQQWFTAAPGLDPPPGTPEYVVLCLGVFLGNTAMGICGFGTAIIHLSVWVLAHVLGFNAGPLSTAVITCSCAMTIGMVPLFFLARARKHAIKPLAISIPIAKGVAAPFGALVLKLLPARQLEAVVAVLMVIMITLINKKRLQGAAVFLRKYAMSAIAGVPQGKRCHSHIGKRAEHGSGLRETLLIGQPAEEPLTPADHASVGPHEWSVGNRLAGASSTVEDDTDTDDGSTLEAGADVLDNLRLSGAYVHNSPAVFVHVHNSNSATAETSGNTQEPSYRKYGSFWGLFAIGAVTGVCTGILGGATGINGPPMMIMYSYLHASKEAVRGTNAVMSLVQDQWIGYYLFGLLHWADVHLYLSAAVAGALGMLIGHSVQKLMDQRHFNAVMSILMALCCALMGCAAAGWIDLAE